ncbi:MAG: hydroxymethylbilane synthase [Nitrososphaerota archaeon]
MLSRVIRVGCRRSRLAINQTESVVETLRSISPGLRFEIVPIATEGDEDFKEGRPKKGKDAFVKAIEVRLLEGEIDFAVHSMKDMPAKLPKGLIIAAVPPREDPRDVLISRQGKRLSELPEGARVGTSSIRRKVQLLSIRPDLHIVEIRGNVDTRIRKLSELNLDAIVLAFAGLKRLGLADLVSEFLPVQSVLPAPGQGALAVEAMEDDANILQVLERIDHRETRICVEAERAFMARIGGGCDIPVAAYARIEDGRLLLDGMVSLPDSWEIIRLVECGEVSEAAAIGYRLAERIVTLKAQVASKGWEH